MRRWQAAAGALNLWVVGGGDLAGQFHDAGLLDEIFVQGARSRWARALPLPRAIVPPALELVSVRQVGRGFAELHYCAARAAHAMSMNDPKHDFSGCRLETRAPAAAAAGGDRRARLRWRCSPTRA